MKTGGRAASVLLLRRPSHTVMCLLRQVVGLYVPGRNKLHRLRIHFIMQVYICLAANAFFSQMGRVRNLTAEPKHKAN